MRLFHILSVLTLLLIASLAMAQVPEPLTSFGKLNNFLDGLPVWLSAAMALVSALATIAALTSTKKDDAIIGKVLTFLKAIMGLYPGNAEGILTKKREK